MCREKPLVLHLLRSTSYSGAEGVALQIMRLTSGEYDSVYASPDGPIRERVKREGCRFYALGSAGIDGVRESVRELQPDLIHAHDFTMATLAEFARTGVPIVAHLHNDPPWLRKPLHPKAVAFAIAAPRLDEIIAVSSSVEQEYVYRKALGKRVQVIGNVVDGERVRELSRAECPVAPPASPYIMFLGRFSPQKNPLGFLRIVRRVVDDGIDVRAVMVGDGEMRGEIERVVDELSLRDRVRLTGFMENPYPLLAKSSALLMPSRWEGFGLVAAEAIALGVPVVASPVGGIPDVVGDESGFLCGSEEEFVACIRTVLSCIGTSQDTKQRNRSADDYAEGLRSYVEQVEHVYHAALLPN